MTRHLLRLAGVLLLAVLSLQLYFGARILLMRWIAPQSTTFQRSEALRLLSDKHQLAWRQEWVDDAQLPKTLKRAVIASEDAGFTEHGGVDWDALQGAWKKNEKAQARAEAQAGRPDQRRSRRATRSSRLCSASATPKR